MLTIYWLDPEKEAEEEMNGPKLCQPAMHCTKANISHITLSLHYITLEVYFFHRFFPFVMRFFPLWGQSMLKYWLSVGEYKAKTVQLDWISNFFLVRLRWDSKSDGPTNKWTRHFYEKDLKKEIENSEERRLKKTKPGDKMKYEYCYVEAQYKYPLRITARSCKASTLSAITTR